LRRPFVIFVIVLYTHYKMAPHATKQLLLYNSCFIYNHTTIYLWVK